MIKIRKAKACAPAGCISLPIVVITVEVGIIKG